MKNNKRNLPISAMRIGKKIRLESARLVYSSVPAYDSVDMNQIVTAK